MAVPPDTTAPALPAQCVIFDMDGTIVRPRLNFDQIRSALQLSPGPILEQLDALSPPRRSEVERGLYRFEMEAAVHSELQPGARHLLTWLVNRGVKTALITRNCRSAVDVVLVKHALSFDLVRSREDGPTKPAAEPILACCRRLGAEPHRTWTVGDHHYDILAGRAAGTTTVLLVNGPRPPPYAAEGDHVIGSLEALPELLGLVSP